MRIKIASAVLAVGLVVAACGGGSDDGGSGTTSEPKAGGTLTVAHPIPPSSLDPVAGSSGGDQMSLYPLYDRLVNFDPETLEATPGLATEWKTPDEKTLVLTIRDGVNFQDGTALDAEAVKFSLDRALDPDISKVVSDLANVDSVEVSGPLEVTIHLKQADASVLLTLADRAGMVVSPTAVEKEGADFGLRPVGAGAYAFEEYVTSDHLTLTKNEDYWQQGKPYLDEITFTYLTNQQTANSALQSGQVDVALNADLANLSTLENMAGISVAKAPSLLTEGCYLNFSREPLSNVDARRALAIAFDREGLNKALAFGEAVPTSSIFPEGYWANDDSLNDTFQHDPDEVKALLAKAGYPDGMKLEGLAFEGTAQVRKTEILQEQLKKVGIDMEFEVYDVNTTSKLMFTDKAADIICSSWSGRPDPSQTANALLSPTSFYNAGAFAAPGMVEALAEASAAQTKADRAAAFSKVIAINQDQVVWIPLLNNPNITAISDKIQGLETNLSGKVDVTFLSRKS